MRDRCGLLAIAALSMTSIACGVATDVLLADALVDAVNNAVADALVTDTPTPVDSAASEVRAIVDEAVDDFVDVVDELFDAVVDEFAAARDAPPDSVTVTLVNNSALYPIEVTVAYDDHELPLLWFGFGEEETFVLQPGETVSFWEDCDDMQTLVIDDADLLIPDSPNRETESGLLNEGIDFECDDEIRFVFDHSEEIRDFDVRVTIFGDDGIPRQSLQDSIESVLGD